MKSYPQSFRLGGQEPRVKEGIMGESSKRALRKDVKFLLLPAAIVFLVALAFTLQAVQARPSNPEVKLVATGNPSQDLSVQPLIIPNVGNTASMDLLVELPETADIFAAEFHFSLEPRGIVAVVDAEPGMPGFNLKISGDGLALTSKERLRTTIVGFPDNGDAIRSCAAADNRITPQFTATISGGQEVPPNASPARGSGIFTLNPAQTELAFFITVDMGSLLGPMVASHIHNAPPGVNGPIVRTLTFSGDTASGVWKSSDPEPLTPALVNRLLAGNLYVNVHTTVFPGGEVRGQILNLDSIYTFIKGATGDDTNIQLQLLSQTQRPQWGDSWCGPTAAGISLAWFAETNPNIYGSLVPDPGNNGIDTGDKYNVINTLGAMMKTMSGDGTTDSNLVDGIEKYISSVGLTGDFAIKVFNHPFPFEYFNELQTGDEDVLVGIRSGDGNGHWLVGRSFSSVVNDNGTTADPTDDYFFVSFVDPGTASVYHTKMQRGPSPGIWYKGAWVEFDIMVSVSPTPPGGEPNEGTAQYFVAQNEFFTLREARSWTGDFTFTLLGDPNPANTADFRTLPLVGDAQGRLFLARLTVRAVNQGTATIRFAGPGGMGAPVKLVMINNAGDPVLLPVSFSTPAATIQVSQAIKVMVKLQGPGRPDPRGWEMPLDIKLFSPGIGDNVLTDTPVATYVCAKMARGTGDDGTPRGVCTVTADQIGTFDIAVKSARTLLHVERAVVVPGTVDFDGPAHDPEEERGLHEGDMDGDGFITLQDVTLWVDTWRAQCAVDPPANINGYPTGDFDKNCSVNLQDFTILLANWREVSPQED